MVKKKKICHVCKKEKKPYHKFMVSDFLSIMTHFQAREKGEICERCDTYFVMTGEFKDATKEEFEVAEQACKFARDMLKWWEKDRKMNPDSIDNLREWDGTNDIAKWYRKEFSSKQQKSKEKKV